MSDKLKDDVEKLRSELRRLEAQVAALSNAGSKKIITDMKQFEKPYETAVKFQRCKNCSNMRMPHRSNPHYTCTIRQSIIEPKWTCGLYSDKAQ